MQIFVNRPDSPCSAITSREYAQFLDSQLPYLDSIRYSPRLWEKWLHAAYFGRVYYWIEGLSLVGYHFDPHFENIPESSWYSNKARSSIPRLTDENQNATEHQFAATCSICRRIFYRRRGRDGKEAILSFP